MLRTLIKARTPLLRNQNLVLLPTAYIHNLPLLAPQAFTQQWATILRTPLSASKVLPGSISQTSEGETPVQSSQDLTRRNRDSLSQGCGL